MIFIKTREAVGSVKIPLIDIVRKQDFDEGDGDCGDDDVNGVVNLRRF